MSKSITYFFSRIENEEKLPSSVDNYLKEKLSEASKEDTTVSVDKNTELNAAQLKKRIKKIEF